MKISVLLPTRKRTQLLPSAIDSLLDNAADPDQVEFLLGVDDDDPSDYGPYLARPRFSVARSERWGYKHLHQYYNALAEAARGTMLVIWNDDLTMLTRGWDEKLLAYHPQLRVQFFKRDILPGAEVDTAYPALPRRYFEVLGHLSLNCHTDSWVWKVADRYGGATFRQDIVIHHAHGTINDETAREEVGDPEGWRAAIPAMEAEGDAVKFYLTQHPEEQPR